MSFQSQHVRIVKEKMRGDEECTVKKRHGIFMLDYGPVFGRRICLKGKRNRVGYDGSLQTEAGLNAKATVGQSPTHARTRYNPTAQFRLSTR